MLDFQSQLIFPTHAVPRAGPPPARAELLTCHSANGCDLHGIHIPADRPSPEKTLILGFGGNAWNGQDVAEYLHELFPQTDVVVFHYRGYAPSSGSPSAAALLADAPLIYDYAVERIQPQRTFAIGFSIGTGVAAKLANDRPLDGVILVTPFDSLRAVAQSMYPWLPIGPFFQHEFDAAGYLEHSNAPVAVLAAERDQLIPAERTEALRKRLPHLVFDRTIQGAGHNDIFARSDFQLAMREALDRLET